ncbi:hydroxysqualene dehydroxylase HpnE [Hydrocarboniclastica marina]|uniref:FAD-dependent oxidoreductase n=1 Tax=Hydrocarboniclastica marina TaxID=2259620 RepID=A0A4P7XLE9_9ALTE|nr:hydroxysqualene dehydroxylase HpnE [Hydrocarboniclastica marina]QCF27222.1 FAD-dependent oxidoreductase [Hydrocarboniclastica marina]
MKQDTDVIIVGGGIAGLTSAVGLSQRGLKVTLLERSDRLGGRARTCEDDTTGQRVDIGPHIMVSQYRNMMRLLRELGTIDQVVWQSHPHLILVDKPRPVVMRLRLLIAPLHFAPSLLNVPQVSLADLLSNRRVLWQILRLDHEKMLELDAINAEEHLLSMGVSARAVDWFWRSAAMTIMNTPLEHCSTGALFRFIRFLAGRNDYQVGFAGDTLSDLFAPGAAERIEAAGGQLLLNTDVQRLELEGNRFAGVRLQDGTSIAAKACIVAVPPQDLKAMLPSSASGKETVFGQLDGFKPSPYICSYLWFDRKLTDEPFWTKVWGKDNLNYDFYDLSNIKPALKAQPSVIASNCMYSLESAALDDAEIVRRTQAEVAEYLPEAAEARVLHARVHRIPMGIAQPSPGTERLRPDSRTPLERLYLAGDWINTGLPSSMESATRAGWLAAEQVLSDRGEPCQLAEPLPPLTGLARLVGGRQHVHE